ncbi:Uncharacterised protein [Janthinobacterium lividum]|nr:Uncharacterised protein [Janthinobacterium lividum]STR27761.1 Uncharacterised protein [Janthinobacterium lividum]
MQVLQTPMINLFDGMPVQASEAGYMGNGEQLRQRLDPEAYAVCDTRASIKPGNMLGDARIAVMTIQSPYWHVEPDTLVQHVAVAYLAPSALMHQRAGLVACPT